VRWAVEFRRLVADARIAANNFETLLCPAGSDFLVQLLRPWSSNLGQRLIQTPKVYLDDTGLLSHLLGLTADRLQMDGTLAGGVLENFVLMELRKQSAWSEIQPELFLLAHRFWSGSGHRAGRQCRAIGWVWK
jgi:predicted AAA+ superfamily ATPase